MTGLSDQREISRRNLLALTTVTAGGILTGCNSDSTAQTAPGATSLAAMVSRWDTDPWARGSYSAIPAGSSQRARRVLADAIMRDRVVLAGEYVSTSYPSTVHGALQSGRRAASRLLGGLSGSAEVVVVGAGIAGLTAAGDLQAAGHSVRVFEARERIGGRIHTSQEWGFPVELGASWVHGVRGNPLTALVEQAGCGLVATDYDDAAVRGLDGRAVSLSQPSRELERQVRRLERGGFPKDLSVAQALRQAGWSGRGARHKFLQATLLTQEYGIDPDELGVRALSEGKYDRPGGDALVTGGFARVPDFLAKPLRVKKNAAVAKVQITEGRAKIYMESGATQQADAVVVAVPLALVQAGVPRIDPWPSAMRQASESLTTGHLERVVLSYDNKWWPDAQLLSVVGAPRQRWSEWYDLSRIVGRPVVAGFAGGRAALSRPVKDVDCISQAERVLHRAFRYSSK